MIRPSSAPVREGDLLAGKYRVERVLGAGGMGIVVAARHVELDQLVAIKFVRDDALENEDAVQRFLREARAAVKLKSEHVARVLDVGKLESGAPYMVMEYLEGSDLGKCLETHGPVPVETAADWILQACEAVAEAHAAGIVHRDLKPENLFLTRSVGGAQKVKVLDFGVSKAMSGGASGELSGLTRTRAMLGSPLYMAPEQMRSSRDVDARADIWALGVVLFQLLTQRFPFEAETMPELCLKVVTEQPLSLALIRPDVPPALVDVIEQCLAKDPKERFGNAAELATALEPFAQPASRILAERARLAIGGSIVQGLRGSVPRLTPASSTLQSGDSSGQRSRTPGTSAAWGAQGAGTTPAPGPTPRPRSVPVLAAIAVAAFAGVMGLVVVTRGSAPASASPPPGPAAPVAAESSLPPAAVRPVEAIRPAPAGGSELALLPGAAPSLASSAALSLVPSAAATGLPAAPVVASRLAPAVATSLVVRSAAPGPHKPTPGLRPDAPAKPAAADDDIPTIR